MTKFLIPLAGMVALAMVSSALAQAPASGAQSLAITPQQGPWVIMVTSFMGDDSSQLAYDFALELRQKYRLAAYTFNRSAEQRREADLEAEKQTRHRIEIIKQCGGDPEQVHLHIRRAHVDDQYAVLLGGFRDLDQAHAMLEKIRKLPPPPNRFMAATLTTNENKLVGGPEYLNPFRSCIAVPNPTVPHDDVSKAPDPFWKRLNENETYSLFKCPKRWTLAIIELQGAAVVQDKVSEPTFLQKLMGTEDHAAKEYLDASATQAHEIAHALRDPRLGLETYVLHTRVSSIVTVGSFDGPNDPRLKDMQSKLAQLKLNLQSGPQFRCFTTPMPMQVPHY